MTEERERMMEKDSGGMEEGRGSGSNAFVLADARGTSDRAGRGRAAWPHGRGAAMMLGGRPALRLGWEFRVLGF